MFGRRRAGYTLITKHSQILDHHNNNNNQQGDTDEQRLSETTTLLPQSNTDDKESPSSPTEQISIDPNLFNSSASTISTVVYTIYGFQHSIVRTCLFNVLSVLLIGIPYLVFKWFPAFISFKYRKCNLNECDIVFVTNNCGDATFENVLILVVTEESAPYYGQLLGETNNVNSSSNRIQIFQFEHVRYVFNNRIEQFVRLQNLDECSTTNDLMHLPDATEMTNKDRREVLLQLYGTNSIEIAVKSYWELFCSEILNPFYLFQIFSITLWSLDEYYYYAGCVLFLSGVSIFSSLYETRSQSIMLHNVIENLKTDKIQIAHPSRDSEWTSDDIHLVNISPDYLVPGDVIALPIDGGIMACDAVLLSGSCIVNESMLTGESVPVTKTPPMPSKCLFEWASQKRHILYAGTTVLQTRYYGNEKVLAKCVRTGFNTSKGELIKSILFPRPIEFQFYADSVKFVLALFCVAAIGMVYTVRMYVARNVDIETILLRTLDIITIVIPPALPLAMTAGTIYSQARLRKQNIFCISPQRINVCGKLKLVCFDKTGTLTDDGLTMAGCIECRNGVFITNETQLPHTFDEKSVLVQILATCHSLTTINGTLNGDPLDIEMFRSIDWEHLEPGREHTRFDTLAPTIVRPRSSIDANDKSPINGSSPTSNDSLDVVPYSIGIIKQHQFSSEAQCMSVIGRVLGENYMKVFSKGAPEKILSLCRPKTIPANFYQLLYRYTSCGYRVIALAHKKLSSKCKWTDVERMKRTEIETDLVFDGFLILLNCLKPETTNIIEELHAANLRTVMITGDNIMTALSVAKDCKMIQPDEEIYIIKCCTTSEPTIYDNGTSDKRPQLSIELCRDIGAVTDDDNEEIINSNENSADATLLNISTLNRYHLALDGHTWNVIQSHYTDFIPNIVARGTIFARFRPEQKSQIVLCLQQFDYIVAMCGDGANDCGALKAAHIGISLSQAEASVAAPFTSKDQNITCVKYLALEGRCALVTSFGLFKYMTMYSLIQFCTILVLYSYCSILGNFQFLYIDLIITASLAFTMGRQGPAKKLVAKRPSSSLISLSNVIPLLMQVLLCAAIQIGAIIYLFEQDWYRSRLIYDNTAQCNYENASLHTYNQSAAPEFVERTLCWENTVLFLVSCFQYLVLGVVYSKGPPYRQPLYTNGLLVAFVAVLSAATLWLVVRPPEFLSDIFEIQPFADTDNEVNAFRISILLFPFAHLLLSNAIEFLIVDRRWFKRCLHFVQRKKMPKNRFKKIELDMANDGRNWFEFLNGDTIHQHHR